MKSLVIYFSQSGSTKKIAEAIYSGVAQHSEQSDLCKLKEVDPGEVVNYDLIGLGSPVWHQREPANVTRFLKALPILEGKYGFSFCTHGVLVGGYIARMVSSLKEKGLTITGWNDWFGTYHYGPQPYFTHGHPDEIDLKEAENFGTKMALNARGISEGRIELVPELPEGEEYFRVYGKGMSDRPGGEELLKNFLEQFQFNLDRKKCKNPKCTICVDHCPVSCIDMSEPQAISNEACDRCFFCEMLCPTGAIHVERPIKDLERLKEHYFGLSKELWELKDIRRFRCLVPEKELLREKALFMVEKYPRLIIRDGVGVLRS